MVLELTKQNLYEITSKRELDQYAVAKLFGVSVSTIHRRIKEYGFGLECDYRNKNYWQFDGIVTEPLAYIVGTYLTDGWVNSNNGLSLSVVSKEFAIKFRESIQGIGLEYSSSEKKPGPKSKQVQFVTNCYSSTLSRWLGEESEEKYKIPRSVLEAKLKAKMEFIAAIIDGDGTVTKFGSIKIRSSSAWLADLYEMLNVLGISATIAQESVLPDGKPYFRVFINRKQYLEAHGVSYIPEKYDRMLNAYDNRKKLGLR